MATATVTPFVMGITALLVALLYFYRKLLLSSGTKIEAWRRKRENELNVYYQELLESWPRDVAKEDIRGYEEAQVYAQRPLLVTQSVALAIRRVPISARVFPLRSYTGLSVLSPREFRYRSRSESKLRASLKDWYQTNPPPIASEGLFFLA